MKTCKTILSFVLLLATYAVFAQESDEDYAGIMDIDDLLIISADKGDTATALKLIARGAFVNTSTYDGVTPLMFASQNGNTDMVSLLLKHSANANMKPDNGYTALISAILSGFIQTAEFLVRNGANINLSDDNKVTPLMHAIAVDSFYFPDMLLYYGADIGLKDENGIDALMLACQLGRYEIAIALLEAGSDINSSDLKGNTPLHYAGNDLIMELLLLNGALLESKNSVGYTPLSVAIAKSDYNASRLLIGYGADVNSQISPSVNILNLAQSSKNDSLITLLLNNEAIALQRPYFNKFTFGTRFSFNKDDSNLGFSFGLNESKYNLMTYLGFGFRHAAAQVLEESSENTYYQYWEKRNFVSITLEKSLFLHHLGSSFSTGAFVGFSEVLTFGSYRGSSNHPGVKLVMNPKIGCVAQYDFIRLKISYEFMNLHLERYMNGWYSISLELLINRKRESNGIPELNLR
jgi:ankyrin repeat protein